jgi:hypothetical protein
VSGSFAYVVTKDFLLFPLETILAVEPAASNSSQLMSSSKEKGKNVIDSQYEKLGTEIKPVSKSDKIYKKICEYVENGHGPTHDKYKLKVKGIFEVGPPTFSCLLPFPYLFYLPCL